VRGARHDHGRRMAGRVAGEGFFFVRTQ